MANKGPNTNGSQFYICYAAQPQLDGQNTVFAKVVGDEGLKTLGQLESLKVDKKGRFEDSKEVRILSTTIHANPLAS